MGKIVVIDEEECTGCETCVELCPEVFEFGEDNEVAKVIMPEGGDEDCIEEAVDSLSGGMYFLGIRISYSKDWLKCP